MTGRRSGRPVAGRRSARWILLASVPLLFALGCEEGARTGSVYRVRVPYGPWWVYPTVYDRPLALGRPKVTMPPAADAAAGAAKPATAERDEAATDEK